LKKEYMKQLNQEIVKIKIDYDNKYNKEIASSIDNLKNNVEPK